MSAMPDSLGEAVARARQSGDFSAVVDAIPYFGFLGLQVHNEGGQLTVLLPAQDKHVGNPTLPALHGGVLGALLEAAAILQLLANDTVHVAKTIDVTVDFLRSAKLAETRARATIVRRGRRVANLRVEAWQEDPARPVAAARGNFLLT
jgi:uncharacterized protein (TIGR00369 family)